MKLVSFLLFIFFIILLLLSKSSFAQKGLNYYPKSTDSYVIYPLIKHQFIYELNNTSKYDSLLGIKNNKKYKYDESNFSLQLLYFEQGLIYDTLVDSHYKFLLTKKMIGQTGHLLKFFETLNFILEVTCSETFTKKELCSYMNVHKSWEFYNDDKPWCYFKSFKRRIDIVKCTQALDILKFK